MKLNFRPFSLSLFVVIFALAAGLAHADPEPSISIATTQYVRGYVKDIVDALGTASQKDVGVANGVASLDSAAKVPIAQIPTGTTSTTVVRGDDSRVVNSVQTTGSYTMSGTYTVTGTLNVPTPPLPPVN